MSLQSIAPGLWVHEGKIDAGWLKVPCRMVVVELAPGQLLVHSPFDVEVAGPAVREMGDVVWRVAPNAWHHLGQREWQAAFPDSRLAAAAALQGKRPALEVDLVLDDAPADAFGAALAVQPVPGSPGGETVFLHGPSRRLIIADLAAHMDDSFPLAFRAYGRLAGIRRQFGVSRILRRLYTDRQRAAAAIRQIQGWAFDRIVPAHGPIIEVEPRAAFAAAFAWLPGGVARD